MYQILRQKFPALILCVALLLTLCGCQNPKDSLSDSTEANYPFSSFPLDSESVASLEATYGTSLGDLAKEWGFSINDLVQRPVGSGMWYLDKTTVIEGTEFMQTLMIDMNYDMCTGFEYSCYCDSKEEIIELSDAIYSDIVNQYGEPAYTQCGGESVKSPIFIWSVIFWKKTIFSISP